MESREEKLLINGEDCHVLLVAGQKCDYRFVELVGVLEHRKMTNGGLYDEPRVGDRVR
jgi:hypothetical protein